MVTNLGTDVAGLTIHGDGVKEEAAIWFNVERGDRGGNCDGDGLGRRAERLKGTDPEDINSDGDTYGVDDRFEVNKMRQIGLFFWSLITIISIISAPAIAQDDNTPPRFEGVKEVYSGAEFTVLVVRWESATDESPPITYEIYISTVSGEQNFSNPNVTVQNETIYGILDLEPYKEYYVVVRAVDVNGNRDNNTIEKYAFLYPHEPFPSETTPMVSITIAILIIIVVCRVTSKITYSCNSKTP